MGTDQKLMYAFRGWIAFVAFMDLGVAVRSYIEKRCFLGEHSYTQSDQLLEKGLWIVTIHFLLETHIPELLYSNLHESFEAFVEIVNN